MRYRELGKTGLRVSEIGSKGIDLVRNDIVYDNTARRSENNSGSRRPPRRNSEQ